MTADALGQFAEGFKSMRRMLANSPQPARLEIFINACAEAASYVAKGLDRAVATAELHEIASSHGLDDRAAVQFIINRAFQGSP